jgi:hypothetical protein
MGIANAKHRGKIRIKGRPKEMARAEIMIMKQKEGYENRKRRRTLFTLLDLIMIVSFGLSIYFGYVGDYTKVILFLIIASIPLVYFIVRRILKNKKKR